MVRLNRTIASVMALLALGSLPHADAATSPTSRPSAMTLVWSDEFNYTGKPDPSKWGYEIGYIRNREPQRYTSDPKNVRVENGHLVIEAAAVGGDRGQFTSACVVTAHKASWLYGRIAVRAALPTAPGAWPAIWTLGASSPSGKNSFHSPAYGEIDIMEFWPASNTHQVRSTLHFSHDGKHGSIGRGDRVADPSAYHVYSTDWTPTTITFAVDGKTFQKVRIDDPQTINHAAFHRPHYLLLNLALEPKRSKIDQSKLPMRMLVDWVRVYQMKPGQMH